MAKTVLFLLIFLAYATTLVVALPVYHRIASSATVESRSPLTKVKLVRLSIRSDTSLTYFI